VEGVFSLDCTIYEFMIDFAQNREGGREPGDCGCRKGVILATVSLWNLLSASVLSGTEMAKPAL